MEDIPKTSGFAIFRERFLGPRPVDFTRETYFDPAGDSVLGNTEVPFQSVSSGNCPGDSADLKKLASAGLGCALGQKSRSQRTL